MAHVINQDEQELIEKYQVHIESEKNLNLILTIIKDNHKDKFCHKLYKKLFKCKVCEAYERVVNG